MFVFELWFKPQNHREAREAQILDALDKVSAASPQSAAEMVALVYPNVCLVVESDVSCSNIMSEFASELLFHSQVCYFESMIWSCLVISVE